jgi:hypothetical protein
MSALRAHHRVKLRIANVVASPDGDARSGGVKSDPILSLSGEHLPFGADDGLFRAATWRRRRRLIAMFKPEQPSPPLTPERLALRQKLNDGERTILEAMESELGRPLTEEEERLALEPGALIEQPRPKNPP